jgi:hypothetical protein
MPAPFTHVSSPVPSAGISVPTSPPTSSCISPGSPAATFYEEFFQLASDIQSDTAQINDSTANVTSILSSLIREVNDVTLSGSNVGALASCAAFDIAIVAESVFASFNTFYVNINSVLFGRKRALSDVPQLEALQVSIIDFVNTLYAVVSCDTLAELNSDVKVVLQDAANAVAMAGSTPSS